MRMVVRRLVADVVKGQTLKHACSLQQCVFYKDNPVISHAETLVCYGMHYTKIIILIINKKSTNWVGEAKNALPLKFDPKPSDAAFPDVFFKLL